VEARALRIHEDDDVAVLLSPALAAGTIVNVAGVTLTTRESVPSGHKLALHPIAPGELIHKYGQPFGRATRTIEIGEWVHTHNVETTLGANEQYTYTPAPNPEPSAQPMHTFDGYVRADGRVGIRNELWVLCTVGCINRIAEEAARRAHAKLAREFGGPVDGVYAYTHPYGCAQIGGDLSLTRSVIAALAAHPNCGGVLLMGLGCENNQLQEQIAALRVADPARVRYFAAQETSDEIEEAVRLLTELAENCKTDHRQPVPASQLVLGMKCGGSDGFSGLTANPLVGVLSDRLATWGGTAILTEVPEMFGAEKLLMQRAADEPTFHAVEELINSFKDYFRRYNEPISENPAPGNKAGGITTLEEKSLGCVQKGGARALVRHVLPYGVPLPAPEEGDAYAAGGNVPLHPSIFSLTVGGADSQRENTKSSGTLAPTGSASPKGAGGGLALAWGPGSDVVSCTTLAAAGAQMVLFTTGRGTPFGTCVPTLKISTNSDLANRKPHWIDFNAGRLVDEGLSREALADELLALVLDVASGRTVTKSEVNGCREVALFKDGVIT
jgi:altronate hydrolase